MENKKLFWNVMIIITDLILFGVLIWLIYLFEWSWWVALWYVLVQILGLGITMGIIKLRKSVKKKGISEEKKGKPLDIESIQNSVGTFIKENKELADELTEIHIKPYTPKQEGFDKETVNIAVCKRYWGKTNLFLAILREKFKVVAYKDYKRDNKQAEDKFEQEIDKSVLNPQRMVETTELQLDPSTGISKPVTTKKPIQYVEAEREKRREEKTAKEEGVEE